MKANRLTQLALLTTIALIIFTVEAQIPAPVPIQGVKLGLANIITVYAAFTMRPYEAVLILFCRIFLGSLFTGNMLAMLYSLGGGLLSIAVTIVLSKLLSRNLIWVASIVGAIFHNIGQLFVAAFVAKTFAIFATLPLLMISGIITGAFTGFAAQAVIKRLPNLMDKK